LFGEFDAPRQPSEQSDAKVFLQQLHMSADGTLGDAKFVSRTDNALVAGSRFKSAKCI
jgi:hypothetical protein